MLTAFLVGPDRVLWLWMPVKKECLGLDCIIITLGYYVPFVIMEEHLDGQGPMEGGILCVDCKSW